MPAAALQWYGIYGGGFGQLYQVPSAQMALDDYWQASRASGADAGEATQEEAATQEEEGTT